MASGENGYNKPTLRPPSLLPDDRGWTPVVFAVNSDDLELTKKLIARGAGLTPEVVLAFIKKQYPYKSFSEPMEDLLEHWWMFLPKWSPENHPKAFRQEVKTWLLVCNRSKVLCKDMLLYIIGHLSILWQK